MFIHTFYNATMCQWGKLKCFGERGKKEGLKTLTFSDEVESPKYSLDEVKAITHPGFGGPGRERYSLAI